MNPQTVQIGRVRDTTAKGLDCKWYHKGLLIYSGAVITVKAASIKNISDTYLVVQTICGLVKRDTVNVRTTDFGVTEYGAANTFSICPNPSNGSITITSSLNNNAVSATVYEVLGKWISRLRVFSKIYKA